MKKKKRKRFMYKQHGHLLRKFGQDPDKLRRRAADMRFEKDLCRHSDDERNYASDEAADADDSSPLVCEMCGKEKLRVKLITPRLLTDAIEDDEAREALLKDLLR